MKLKFLFLLLLAGCTNHDLRQSHEERAMQIACERCGNTENEMTWFRGVIDKAEAEENWSGNIYVGSLQGSIIFIHQPLLVSCLACHVYDCTGTRLTLTADETEAAANQMTESNLIYSSIEGE